MNNTWKIEPAINFVFLLAFSPSVASLFSAIKDITPTTTSIVGKIKKVEAMLLKALALKNKRTIAPNESIAPGSFGNCVPPIADPIINMPKTIKIFSICSFYFSCKNQTFIEYDK
jgi:hypothetical protein